MILIILLVNIKGDIMKAIEYDNIIKNKDDLISQLESLKDEAIYMLKNPYHDEVFQRDLHALRIVINFIKDLK